MLWKESPRLGPGRFWRLKIHLHSICQPAAGHHTVDVVHYFVVAQEDDGRDIIDAQVSRELGVFVYVNPFYHQLGHLLTNFGHKVLQYGSATRPGRREHHRYQSVVAGVQPVNKLVGV